MRFNGQLTNRNDREEVDKWNKNSRTAMFRTGLERLADEEQSLLPQLQ